MNEMLTKGAVLVVVLLGHDYRACYTAQQMSFDHFRHSYSHSLCAKDGQDLRAALEQTQ